jgi:hypothetical protein
VDENGREAPRRRTWRGRTGIALVLLLALLIAFHRPVLLGVGRMVANHFLAKEHLKLDFRAEGNLFTGVILRNVHLTPTGPAAIESIDADFVRARYSLLDLVRHGDTEFLKELEVRSARVVIDPSKSKPSPPKPNEKITLPTSFPDLLRATDFNLIVRLSPQPFVLEHVDLDLNPRAPGVLRIAKLQLPDHPAWTKLSAQTSYTNKDLMIRGLNLDSENQLRLVAIDASRIKSKSLEIVVDSTIAGGTVAGSASLRETQSSLETKIRLNGANISLENLGKDLNWPAGILGGNVERLAIEWSGTLNKPRSWSGSASAEIKNLQSGGFVFDNCNFNVTTRNGTATITSADAAKGENKIQLRGIVELPSDLRDFGARPGKIDINATLPNLKEVTVSSAQPITGSAKVEGQIESKNGTIVADLQANGGPITFGKNGAAEKVTGKLSASKKMSAQIWEKPYYVDLSSDVSLEMSNVRADEYLMGSVRANLRSANDLVVIEQIAATRKQNEFVARGEYRLPADFSKREQQDGSLDVSVRAPEAADFYVADSPNKISGPVQALGQIEFKHGRADGQLSIFGSGLKARNLSIPQLSYQCTIAKNVLYLNDLTASLNEHDFVGASGEVELEKPYRYRGTFSANIAKLATLNPLLAAFGNENVLAGSLVIDWEGEGEGAQLKNSGKLKLVLDKGRYANAQSLQANIDASYTPEGLDVPTIFFRSDKMDFQAIMQAKGSTLEISKIQIDQGQNKYAAGYISVPFVWKNIGTDRPVIAGDGNVTATFQSENLDLKKLFEDVGAKPVASGLVNVKLEAHGALSDLVATLDLQARDLRSPNFPKLDPATFDLSLRTERNELAMNGKFQQAKIQPVTLEAKLPFNASKVLRARGLDDRTPITAKIDMPRSSVNFIRQFVPELEQLDGDVALNVNVNGTIADPILTGSGDMTVNRARFTNATIPSLGNFKARLGFNRNTLTVEQFGGDLAGGPFKLSGSITFLKLTEPTLDLQLKADSVLVARNDSVTARADADIKIAGPFNSASVTGTVAITNSQFLKNIDLIPIGLPGRPAPQPPSSRPDFSFPDPPLRGWKFDVAIKTKDPFLLRGNLANGGAIVDLHLIGTGLRPGLQGLIRLENVEATLPFSRMDVSSGFLYFDPSDSLNPKIELHGTSLIRDYTVHVYVYGTSLEPEAVFTSEPPLPQEEIISLLATGTTREELTGNNNVLAGRAAMLLVQQLYRKIFKKGSGPQNTSVFDRLDVDVGQVDARTGQQTATGRFKLNKQFVLVGDLEVGGDFRGMLKYLIRFR